MRGKKRFTPVLLLGLLACLLFGCAGMEEKRETAAAEEKEENVTAEEKGEREATAKSEETVTAAENEEAVTAFQSKAEILRAEVLSDQVQEWLVENPAGEAGYALFLSVCDSEKRASVYNGTGETPDAAWDAAVQEAETALKKGGPAPFWLKADLVYVSSELSANALKGIGEVFGDGGFRYGLAFDPAYETALLEAELNTAGIYDYKNGSLDLERLNAYLEENGREPLASLPESYTAFQCAGWLCDEEGSVFRLGLEDLGYGRREFSDVSGNTAAALALDGAEYLADQVQADGRILLPKEGILTVARHAEAVSAMTRGYLLHPGEKLAGSLNRAANWLASQIAYTKEDMGFFVNNGEITLEDSALALIALADCAEASGNMAYLPACQALGAGFLSRLNSETGTFTHVLNASDLSKKEAFRAADWDSMGVAALCRLYEMTEDSLWLWAADRVMDRIAAEEPDSYGNLWTAYALREMTEHVQDRADYFVLALKNVQGGLAAVYGAQGTEPAGLEMLMVSYETYCKMQEAGYSSDGFSPELLREVITARANRQLDGYLFPEFAMYFPEPQSVLGAFTTRENGLSIASDEMCRNVGGYYLYAINYDSLMEIPD